jgi:hypothetical protein
MSAISEGVEFGDNALSGSIDSLVNGPAPRLERPPVTSSASRLIPSQNNVLRSVIGSRDLTATDSAVIGSDRGLTTALKTGQAAQRSLSGSLGADVARSTGSSPTLTAMNGNWGAEAASNANPSQWDASIDAMLNRDDNYTLHAISPQ